MSKAFFQRIWFQYKTLSQNNSDAPERIVPTIYKLWPDIIFTPRYYTQIFFTTQWNFMTEYFCVFSDNHKLFVVSFVAPYCKTLMTVEEHVCHSELPRETGPYFPYYHTPASGLYMVLSWCNNFHLPKQSVNTTLHVCVHHFSFLSLWMTCLSFKMRPCWKGQWGRIGECQKSFFVIYYFSFHFYITTVSIAVQCSYCPAEVVDMTMSLKRWSCFHVWFDIYSKYDILEKELSLI